MKEFDWINPYPSVRIPLFARNVVSTSHPLAAQAGLRMMLKGGNALDAAIAGAVAITLSEPVSCGIGGDCFAIFCASKKLHGLNSSCTARTDSNGHNLPRNDESEEASVDIRPD